MTRRRLLVYSGALFTGLLLLALARLLIPLGCRFFISSECGFTFGDETIVKNLQRHELIFTCAFEDWRLPWNSYNLGVAA
jgi:hypothetical protein